MMGHFSSTEVHIRYMQQYGQKELLVRHWYIYGIHHWQITWSSSESFEVNLFSGYGNKTG